MIHLLFLILLEPALKCADGKQYRYIVHAIVAWFLDVYICHTTWAAIAGKPHRGEWTISDMLERLCREFDNPDHKLWVATAKKINRISPTKAHIKAVL